MTDRARSLSVAGIAVLRPACGGGAAGSGDAAVVDAGDGPSFDAGAPDSGGAADAGTDAPVQGGYVLPEFPGGVSFFIQLPPQFAPFLPLSGDEATREPATFYDTTSDYFFSYGFVWWLNGAPDLSTAGLREYLRTYFTGLCHVAMPIAVTLNDPVWRYTSSSRALVFLPSGP